MENKCYSKQLCWGCKNATGGCSWAQCLVPVDGWNAEPTILKDGSESFIIKSCPEFKADDIEVLTQGRLTQRLMRILNVSQHQLNKMKSSTVINRLKELGFEIYCYYDEEEKHNTTLYGFRKI